MVDFTKLAADMDAIKTAADAAVTDHNALMQQIADLKATVASNDPTANQAAVDALDAKAQAVLTSLQGIGTAAATASTTASS